MKQPASRFPPSACLTLSALALCLTPLIAVPAFAADGESATQASIAARRAAIDKDTKQLRAPESDERGAAADAATTRSATGQSMLRSPNALRFQAQTLYGKDGTETRRLDLARALRFSVAHRHADGTLHKDCVVGEDGVHLHLSMTPEAIRQGANHE